MDFLPTEVVRTIAADHVPLLLTCKRLSQLIKWDDKWQHAANIGYDIEFNSYVGIAGSDELRLRVDEAWTKDGKLHREDGPAVIWEMSNWRYEGYWMNGEFVRKDMYRV